MTHRRGHAQLDIREIRRVLHAGEFYQPFFRWYNHEHRHSDLGFVTPAAMHYGKAEDIRGARVLAVAYAANPECFINSAPQPAPLPTATWINKPDIGGGCPLKLNSSADRLKQDTLTGTRICNKRAPRFGRSSTGHAATRMGRTDAYWPVQPASSALQIQSPNAP